MDLCLANTLLLDHGVGLSKSGGCHGGTSLVCVAYWAVVIVWYDKGSYLTDITSAFQDEIKLSAHTNGWGSFF